MRKIKNNLRKIIKTSCSANEYKFVIYLAAHQDFMGRVANVNQNEVIELLGISKSEFYFMLERMDREMKKGIAEKTVPEKCPKCETIIIEKKHNYKCESCNYKIIKDTFDRPRLIYVDRRKNKKYWDITLLNNNYKDKNDISVNGSLDIRHNFILTKEFMSLSKKALSLGMDLLGFMNPNEPYQKHKLTRKSMLRWIDTKSLKILEKTIKELEQWYVIEYKKGVYYTYLKEIYHKKDSLDIIIFANKIMELCRNNKIKVTSNNSLDIARLAGQYKKRIQKLELENDSIMMLKELLLNIIKRYKEIEVKLVHKIYREYILSKEKQRKKDKPKQLDPNKPNLNSKIKTNNIKKPTFNNFKNRNYDIAKLKENLLRRTRESWDEI